MWHSKRHLIRVGRVQLRSILCILALPFGQLGISPLPAGEAGLPLLPAFDQLREGPTATTHDLARVVAALLGQVLPEHMVTALPESRLHIAGLIVQTEAGD